MSLIALQVGGRSIEEYSTSLGMTTKFKMQFYSEGNTTVSSGIAQVQLIGTWKQFINEIQVNIIPLLLVLALQCQQALRVVQTYFSH